MKSIQFIKIANFSDEANKIINQAIYLSKEENCAEVNLVHLLLAILDKSDIGKHIIDKLDIDFEMIHNSYRKLAEDKVYGFSNDSNFGPENFTNEALKVISVSSLACGMNMESVDAETLIANILDSDSKELVSFLNYIGTNINTIKEVINSIFYMPDEIEFFAEDLNLKLSENKMYISNVDEYTNEIIEVLSRKLKANPCLVGEAGVGKTTIVYGLVQRILNGDVPNDLKEKHIVYVNSSLLTAGTRFRGDFEERMAMLLDWASNTNVIIFLDEIHTFIDLNTNGSESNSAGNMIKKYLSDGTINIIGATTPKEYHTSIEKDKAFSRRVQKIDIHEPSIKDTIKMINNTKEDYEAFHKVKINDEAIDSAVQLSVRYIKNKFLPDKAYTILDQTAARAKLNNKKAINSEDIAITISKITGVNINKLANNESKQLMKLEDTIHKDLVGQDSAVSAVCKALRRSKAGVHEPNKPLASFLFVGPTGVGKTELCKVLSKEMSFGKMPLIKIDMSEFSEKYSTSKMIGSAPGYVGYGEGGQLTEKIKNNPYSLLLFDEIEKAHPAVFNIFLQMLDEGRLTDGEGETADLTNCIIVMTSNAGYGADGMQKGTLGFYTSVEKEDDQRRRERIALEALESTFKPEFLNRIDSIVIFDKLSEEQCYQIAKLTLDKLSKRMLQKDIKVKFSESIVKQISKHGYSDKYGARNIKREVQYTVEDILADYIISGKLKSGNTALLSWKNNKVSVDIKGDK